MNNKPFWKKQSFWLNIWVWWGVLVIIYIILSLLGEKSSDGFGVVSNHPLGGPLGYAIGAFASFIGPLILIAGISEVPNSIVDILSEFSMNGWGAILVFIVAMILANWFTSKQEKFKKRIFYNMFFLLSITAIIDVLLTQYLPVSMLAFLESIFDSSF
ncbi:MAG: hypothetical protein Q7R79_02095 [bacterium]|nr:hypothetical protein [bacterium]